MAYLKQPEQAGSLGGALTFLGVRSGPGLDPQGSAHENKPHAKLDEEAAQARFRFEARPPRPVASVAVGAKPVHQMPGAIARLDAAFGTNKSQPKAQSNPTQATSSSSLLVPLDRTLQRIPSVGTLLGTPTSSNKTLLASHESRKTQSTQGNDKAASSSSSGSAGQLAESRALQSLVPSALNALQAPVAAVDQGSHRSSITLSNQATSRKRPLRVGNGSNDGESGRPQSMLDAALDAEPASVLDKRRKTDSRAPLWTIRPQQSLIAAAHDRDEQVNPDLGLQRDQIRQEANPIGAKIVAAPAGGVARESTKQQTSQFQETVDSLMKQSQEFDRSLVLAEQKVRAQQDQMKTLQQERDEARRQAAESQAELQAVMRGGEEQKKLQAAEYDHLKKELATHKDIAHKAEFDRAEVQARLRELEAERKEQATKFEAKADELAYACLAQSDLQTRLHVAEVQVRNVEDTNQDLKRQIELVEAKNEDVQRQKQAAEASLNSELRQKDRLEVQVKTLQDQLSKCQSQLDVSEDKLGIAKQELSEARILEARSTDLATERFNQVQELNKALHEEQEAFAVFKKGAEAASKLDEERLAHIEELRVELREYKRREQELREALEQQKDNTSNTERSITEQELQQRVDALSLQLSTATEAKRAAEMTVEDLRKKARDLEEQLHETTRRYNEASATSSRLTVDLRRSQEDLSQAVDKVANLEGTQQQLQNELKDSKDQQDALQAQVDAGNDKLNDLQYQLDHTVTELTSAKETHALEQKQLQADVAAQADELAQLETMIQQQTSELETLKREHECLGSKNLQLERDVATLRHRRSTYVERFHASELDEEESALCNVVIQRQRAIYFRELSKKENEVRRLESERASIDARLMDTYKAVSSSIGQLIETDPAPDQARPLVRRNSSRAKSNSAEQATTTDSNPTADAPRSVAQDSEGGKTLTRRSSKTQGVVARASSSKS